jgi:hypothetical protein
VAKTLASIFAELPEKLPVRTVRVMGVTDTMTTVRLTRQTGDVKTVAQCAFTHAEWTEHLRRNGYAPEQFPVGRTVRL